MKQHYMATAIKLLLSAVLVIPIQAHAWGGSCEYSKEISRSIDLGSIRSIDVNAGAGSLEINGKKALDVVEIRADLCSSNEDELSKLDVIDKFEDGNLMLRTFFPTTDGWNKSGQSRIDLTLIVPSAATLVVKDSSGDAEISNVAGLDLTDSSGGLEVEDIEGNLIITDSSGDIDIEDIAGDVTLTDSSGSIDVSDVKGSMIVLVDSSGSIEGSRIGKDMIVKADSSGSITADDVGGDFIVEQDGSGGIDYEDVVGEVRLPN